MIRILFVLFAFLTLPSFASLPAEGQLFVEKSCPAYLSKNQKTNPGQVYLSPKQHYSIIEVNREYKPDWIRISGVQHKNSMRWVHGSCGIVNYQLTEASDCRQTPGMADANVLAVSWQPAFCETYGYEVGKPECLTLTKESYSASHLVLHGLWPNQTTCKANYGYCGVDIKPNHCDYPKLELKDAVKKQLAELMPSYRHGSCLERHEWNKHGSCQNLDQNDYFALATQMVSVLNETPFGEYLRDHQGETIKREKLEQTWEQSFGKGALAKLYLGCKNGLLVDIYIQLPAKIYVDDTLTELVSRANLQERDSGCPKVMKISNFRGKQMANPLL